MKLSILDLYKLPETWLVIGWLQIIFGVSYQIIDEGNLINLMIGVGCFSTAIYLKASQRLQIKVMKN